MKKRKEMFLRNRFLLAGIVLLLALTFSAAALYAGNIQLSWSPPTTNTDGTPITDLAGYKIYYGTSSGKYTQSVNAGNNTTYTVGSLADGTTYYFAATAYNKAGIESGYSNEVSRTTAAAQQQYTLTVNKAGTGTGTVSGNGISCGTGCTGSYNAGAVVTLTATPSSGSTFAGWSGGGCSGTGQCSTTLSASQTVTATFNLSQSTGGATPSGTGTTPAGTGGGNRTEEWGNGPTSNHANTVADTFINTDAVSYAGGALLKAYTWPTNAIANATLLKWDLSAIPAGSTIVSATLQLYLEGFDGSGGQNPYNVAVYRITGKNPVPAQATGYTYDGTNPWSAVSGMSVPLAQGDIASMPNDTQAIDTTSGYKAWNVTNMVQKWVSGQGPNYGMLVNADPRAAADSNRSFASSESPNTGHRPKLVITYTPPAN